MFLDLRSVRWAWLRNGGRVGVERIGINQASTFSGFCSYHDNVTFTPVENAPFTASDEQCFLLGYRAMCRELYQKATALDAMGYMRTLDRGCSVQDQVGVQTLLDDMELGQSAGYRDLLERKSDFDRILRTRSFSDVSKYVVFTKEIPEVLATFGVIPSSPCAGRRWPTSVAVGSGCASCRARAGRRPSTATWRRTHRLPHDPSLRPPWSTSARRSTSRSSSGPCWPCSVRRRWLTFWW